MTGITRTIFFSVRTKRVQRFSAAFRNFSPSKPSRTKLFTTRMAEMFSCTLALRSSYFRKTFRKSLPAGIMRRGRIMTRHTSAARKMTLIFGLTRTAITAEATIMAGARTAIRVII